MAFDWAAHKLHREQVIRDQVTWAGLLDENMIPLVDSAPIVEMNAPGMRNTPGSFQATVMVRSPRGVIHPMVDELIAENLGETDEQGRLVPVTDATRFFAVQRAGMQQRVYKIRFVIARGGPSGPSTLEIHASDELSMLQDHPAWSVPTSATGVWERLDRDWATTWSKEHDLQNLLMASQADGFSIHGQPEVVIRRIIRESLATSWKIAGVSGGVPIVVSNIGSDKVSPDEVILRPVDEPLWDTIAPAAMASGVTVQASVWWPGDPQPAGYSLTLPTVVVEARHMDANPKRVYETYDPEPPLSFIKIYSAGWTWWESGIRGDLTLLEEFVQQSGDTGVVFTRDVTCDLPVTFTRRGSARAPGTVVPAGQRCWPRSEEEYATFTEVVSSLKIKTGSATHPPGEPPGGNPAPGPVPPREPRDVVLESDGAEITVGRRTAVYTYGSWDVTIPEGLEQATDPRVRDAYIHRPDNAPQGRFDIAFVRADVAMDINDGTSNVENQFAASQAKASGDVFFERDIEGRGLGRYIPGEDYSLGDLVDVRVWGLRIALPVTVIDFVGLKDYRVHVGGQMLSDPLTLQLANDEVWDAIRAERFRAEQEAARLWEQAAVDSKQSKQLAAQQQTLSSQQSTLSSQQSSLSSQQSTLRNQTVQLRGHSADIVEWSDVMAKNSNIIRMILNLLEIQEDTWLEVADLFESYHNSSGYLRTYTEITRVNVLDLQAQHEGVSKLPPPPQIT